MADACDNHWVRTNLGPFGQSLPFVPKDEMLSHIFSSLHIIFERDLIFSIVLHIVGAFKHHFVDKDATLRRMLPGQVHLPDVAPVASSKLPVIAAVGVYAIALVVSAGMGMLSVPRASNNVTKLLEVESEWKVEEGSVGISVFELGSTTKGNFSDGIAEIDFNEIAEGGVHGSVSVQIALSSLKLVSVTDVAIGPELFDVVQFPTAAYVGPILFDGTNYLVDGSLEIRDKKMTIGYDAISVLPLVRLQGRRPLFAMLSAYSTMISGARL